MQNNCAEIKIRAERKIGEFSKELPKAQGKYQQTSHSGEFDKKEVLRQAGIKHHERYEAIADIPEELILHSIFKDIWWQPGHPVTASHCVGPMYVISDHNKAIVAGFREDY